MAVIPTIEYETKLQERLGAPTLWKEICLVKSTDTGIWRNPYLTDPTLGTGTRGVGYTSTAIATVDDTVSITDYIYAAEHMDKADFAQKTFSDWMEIADRMGTILDEGMEIEMLSEHAQWTNFDNASIGGSAGNITVSISNIKKIVSGIKREIREAGGGKLLARNGGFIVWREADYELVELLASSEGFTTADTVLKEGVSQVNGGFKYLGMWHYSSSNHASGHVFAGVKKAFAVGICKSTYGKLTTIENPVVGGAQISGIGLETRIDSKFKAWAKMVPVLFDVLVA
jgi:hypothetical protein